MKKDTDKTKAQLLAELAELRKKSKERQDKLNASNQQLDAKNQQLRANEEHLRRLATVVTDSNDAITVQDLDGRITAWNRGAEQMYGWTADEALGMNIRDTLPEERREEALECVEQLKKGEKGKSLETKRVTKDGRELDVWLTVTKLVDESNNLTGIATTERDITERKNAEEEILTLNRELEERVLERTAELQAANQQLEASNQQLRAREKEVSVAYDSLNSSVSGVIITNQEGEITYCNPAFLQMFEYKNRDEVTGKYAKDLFTTEKVQKFTDVAAIIDQTKGEIEEFPARRKDGTEFPVEVFSTNVTDQEGNNVGRMASFSDITERKQAEEKLKAANRQLTASEEKYRLLFRNMLDGFAYHQIVTDKNGKAIDYIFMEINDAFMEMTGLKREKIIGKKVTEALPGIENDPADWIGKYGEVALTGKELRFEQYSEPLDRWFSVYAFCSKEGYFATVFEDITERKQAKEKLKNQKTRLNNILEGTNVGTWEWNVQTGETIFNEKWANIIGYTLHEISPVSIETWMKFVHPDDLKKSEELLEKHFNDELDYYHFESRMKHKDGSWIWVLDRGKVITRDDAGNPLMVSGTHQDITERKQAEEKITQQSNFLNNVMESLTYPFYVIDVNDYSILQANTASGYIPGSGKITCHALTHNSKVPCNTQEHPCPLEEVKKTGQPAMLEHIHLDKDGNERNVEVHGVPVIDENGEINSMIEYSLDVTERKQAEEEREKARDYAESITTSMRDALFVVNTDATIKSVNPAASTLLGYTEEELSGMPVGKLFEEEEEEEEEEEFSQQILALVKSRLQKKIDADVDDFYSLMDKAPIGAIQVNNRGFITRVNPKLLDLFGYESDELIEKPLHVLLPESLRNKHEEHRAAFMKHSKSRAMGQDRILNGQRKDGSLIQVEIGLVPVVIDGEKTVLSLVRDAEEDTAWEIVKMTRFGKLFEEEEEEEEEEGFWNVGRRLMAKEGRHIPALVSGSMLRDEAGDIMGAVLVAKDITERKQAEQEIKEKSRQLGKRVKELNCLHDISETVDERETIEEILKDVTEIIPSAWQYPQITCSKITFGNKEYKTENHKNSQWKLSSDIKANNKVAGKIEVAYLKEKPESDIGPFLNEEKALLDTIADQLEHIVEKKQAEKEIRTLNRELEERVRERTAELADAKKQAEQANRAKSEFLANMSHEIRTPMNAVLGFAQILERDSSLTPRQSEQVNSISRGGNHLLGLINDILDISKIEAGKIELSPSVFSLRDLLEDLEMMFRIRAEDKHLQLTVDRDEGLPSHVRTDEDKLRQVLVNLLGNAVKFTEEGGLALRVRSEPVRGRTQGEDKSLRLKFEVEDSGPGISPSDLEKIFDKFSQAEAGARAGGTGLGLALSRQLAEMMDGSLTCESEPGKGSCFCFDLLCAPAEAEQKEPRESRRVTGLAPGTKPGRILVVDDNASSRDLLHALLLPLGFDIRDAENGREAVEIFEEWSPRAVLMGIRMPVMDGYEATRRIRATQAGHAVPVIAVTASAFKEEEEEILATGASAYISKPLRNEEFYEVLGKYLGLSFVYEEEPAEAQKHPKSKDLAPEDLAALPRDLVHDMLEALAGGSMTRLLELIGQVEPLDRDAAQGLKALADRYDYSTLEKLLNNGGNDNE